MSEGSVYPPKLDVVGTGISLTSYDDVLEILRAPRSDRACVVAVCNVHSVMVARRDQELRRALDSAEIATPDGMPLVWSIRHRGVPAQERVYGPDLMRYALANAPDLRHFLYGSSTSTLDRLRMRISHDYPQVVIAGAMSPPFEALSEDDLKKHAAVIRESRADVVWVGLGMPKQELWMNRVADQLPGVTLIGVGAAFDFLAGTVRQAPEWMQRHGLEWAFRLAQEPRRLWRRYLFNNPIFVALSLRQLYRASRAS